MLLFVLLLIFAHDYCWTIRHTIVKQLVYKMGNYLACSDYLHIQRSLCICLGLLTLCCVYMHLYMTLTSGITSLIIFTVLTVIVKVWSGQCSKCRKKNVHVLYQEMEIELIRINELKRTLPTYVSYVCQMLHFQTDKHQLCLENKIVEVWLVYAH